MKMTIKELKEKLNGMPDLLDSHFITDASVSVWIPELNADTESLHKQILELESYIIDLEDENNELESENSDLEDEIYELRQELKELTKTA
jgi:predicted  nucleic acid-binding Zn-ribbon protein